MQQGPCSYARPLRTLNLDKPVYLLPVMDQELGKKIIALRQRVVANFDASNWEEVGFLTGHSTTIDRYPRLLRSLNWGDEDYSGNVLGVLRRIAEKDPKAFHTFQQYVDERFPGESEYVRPNLPSVELLLRQTYFRFQMSQ